MVIVDKENGNGICEGQGSRNFGVSGNRCGLFFSGKIFPVFILYFVLASVITTVAVSGFQVSVEVFHPLKELSKFFIIMAMAAIGLNTDVVKLIKQGGKPILMGFCCWAGITGVSLLMQYVMGIW